MQLGIKTRSIVQIVAGVLMIAAIGYAARRTSAMLRGRLALLAVVTVAISGLVSVNAGLVLSDSSVTLSSVWSSMSGDDEQSASTTATPRRRSRRSMPTACNGSPSPPPTAATHRPGNDCAPAFRRSSSSAPTTRSGCTRVLGVPSTGAQVFLPETGETPIDLGVLQPGQIGITCGMGMYSASLEVIA